MLGGQKAFWRPTLLFAILFFVAGVFLFKLFEHQVLEHKQFVEASAAQSTSTTVQPAQRGKIYAKDKDGTLFTLAASEWRYQLLVSPRQVKNKQKLADFLHQDLPSLGSADIFGKINNDKVYIPPLVNDLDEKTASKINEQGYAGVFLLPKLARVYPDAADIAAHVIGFVGSDGEGKYGVESTHNDQLKGINGNQQAKRDSVGRLIDILGSQSAQAGSDVVLTLDYNLQSTVETKLKDAISKFKADSGSVIVMDPKTGAILALAGQPTFDPNNYSQVPAGQQSSFLAPAVSLNYEPGSVFKPITMSMAIEMGLVQPDTQHNAGGSVMVLGHEITNALDKNFGNQTMTQVLENSDNVQMTWLAGLIGAEKEREFFDKFGFGKKTGLDLVGEQGGYLPPIKGWNDLLRSTAAFGQGVSATGVQLAQAYAVLANGGVTVTPHLVDHFIKDDKAVKPTLAAAGTRIISEDTSKKLREMLASVVNLGEGKRAGVQGMQVAGKTGTAQVPDARGGYDPNKAIGTFAGFFPANDPKYVMVVRLDDPKTVNFAESSAAPTFGEIASWMATYYGLR